MKKVMKKAIFLLIAVVAFGSASAQKKKKVKLDYNDETMIVSANGEPYCMMRKNKAQSLSFNNDFTFMNLEGEELIFFTYGTRKVWNKETYKYETKPYYAITYIGDEFKGKRNEKKGSMGEKGALKEVFRNDLIENSTLDSLSVVKYCSVRQ